MLPANARDCVSSSREGPKWQSRTGVDNGSAWGGSSWSTTAGPVRPQFASAATWLIPFAALC
jgi:hypothetical protein